MEHLLVNPRHRKLFIITILLIAGCSLIIRFFVLPHSDSKLWLAGPDVAAVILDNLFASVLVTAFIGAFIYWLDPEVLRSAKMEVVAAADIGRLLEEAMRTTEVWWFRGATGRYLRSVTLPRIAQAARRSSSTREINVQLLDPDANDVCREYALYRRSLQSAANDPVEWSPERVTIELYATILQISVIRVREPMLRITVGLARVFSLFRLDLSSAYVVVTKEDPRAPGIRCDSGTYFYKAYLDDMVLTARQCRSLPPPPPDFDPDKLDVSSVRHLLSAMRLSESKLGDEDIRAVIERAQNPRNPYA